MKKFSPLRLQASCLYAMCPQYRYQWLRNSSFSSNKDINPTLLARDWDEVRRVSTRVRVRGGGGGGAERSAARGAAGPGAAAEQREGLSQTSAVGQRGAATWRGETAP